MFKWRTDMLQLQSLKKIKGAFEGLGCYVKKLTNPTKKAAENVLQKGKIN